MPVPLDLVPPPQFDRSMLSYVVTNFGRVRDGLLRAFGGDYQTGVSTWPFTGYTNGNWSVGFPRAFSGTRAPLVVLHSLTVGGTMFAITVTGSTVNGIFMTGNTVGGVVAANDCVFKWLAFYP
jgi:hypothetical protein